jgi:hypothetical protein
MKSLGMGKFNAMPKVIANTSVKNAGVLQSLTASYTATLLFKTSGL